jgi:hypothetical protein
MKKLFDIGGDEMRRILSLHESSTQKQYLNVLNEGGGASEVAGYGGVSSNVAQNMAAKMNAAKEQQQNSNPQFYNMNSDTYFLKNNKTISVNKNDLKIFKGITFRKSTKDPNLLYAKSNAQFSNPSGRIMKNFDSGDKEEITFPTRIYYRCNGQYFSTDAAKKDGKYEKYSDNQGGLKNQLNKVCKSKLETPKDKTVKPEVKQPGTKQPVSQEKQQTFSQQNTGYSKSIQTSLGVQPTGQITDADLDNIISKLG